jgi:tellurite resistance protein TerC
MSSEQLTYLIFGAVVLVALVFDLGLLSKKGEIVTIKKALFQTCFWVFLAFAFFGYLWVEYGKSTLVIDKVPQKEIPWAFISAYLMEWSLSIDNIFVFILIFAAFGVKEESYGRILLIGIVFAIVLRIVFITLGVALVEKFDWLLYVFGAFLLYTGYAMFGNDHDAEVDPKENSVYKFLKKFLPITSEYDGEKFRTKLNGKKFYTPLFVVVILVATTDVVFALDSIPAVMGISTNKLVIYTSNIFAVLGLRSLFFLLRGAVSKFDYLPKGIAIVLIFIGIKMLVPLLEYAGVDKHYLHLPVWISLLVIVACLGGSIWYSVIKKNPGVPEDIIEPPNVV